MIKKPQEVQDLIENAVKNNLLFQMVSLPARKAIINSMPPLDVHAGEVIIRQGEEGGSKFYVLEQGTCTVEVRDVHAAVMPLLTRGRAPVRAVSCPVAHRRLRSPFAHCRSRRTGRGRRTRWALGARLGRSACFTTRPGPPRCAPRPTAACG